eukprot:GHVU01007082.1.p1 GENE.GHVU01007082.1~~GHVU01007082.1.p1  ORF type:complete len:265 (+),score=14.78 GHVU01007082.1:203-997(+)
MRECKPQDALPAGRGPYHPRNAQIFHRLHPAASGGILMGTQYEVGCVVCIHVLLDDAALPACAAQGRCDVRRIPARQPSETTETAAALLSLRRDDGGGGKARVCATGLAVVVRPPTEAQTRGCCGYVDTASTRKTWELRGTRGLKSTGRKQKRKTCIPVGCGTCSHHSIVRLPDWLLFPLVLPVGGSAAYRQSCNPYHMAPTAPPPPSPPYPHTHTGAREHSWRNASPCERSRVAAATVHVCRLKRTGSPRGIVGMSEWKNVSG